MILQCPNCKSFRIIEYSKSKYLIRLFICLILTILCVLEVLSLIKEDLDPVVIIGLLGGLLLFLLSIILTVYYLIKIVKTKKTTYVCDRCKSKLKTDEIIRNVGRDEEILLETIKKRK